MTSVEKVARELVAMDGAIAKLTEQFQTTYANYLKALGQALRQQLILAVYQLCTRTYPQEFLSLSLKQREQLQQSLRQIASQVQTDLLALVESDRAIQVVPDDATPVERLERWLEFLEQQIAQRLQLLSYEINGYLRDAGILSEKLLDPLLQAAAHPETMPESANSPPNLLAISVKKEPIAKESIAEEIAQIEQRGKLPETLRATIVALRLSEIEFADATVMSIRHQVRSLMSQFAALQQEYAKKQRERLVAEAENSWRAIWFDE